MSLESIAKNLREASTQKKGIAPVREEIPQNSIEMAYQIQAINNKIRTENGAKVTGKKIGLTSKKVQQQLGVDQPDFGLLFNDMEVKDGGTLAWSETMQPKVEAEITFVLKEDINDENPSLETIENAIDYATASLEVVGSRIQDWNIKILDTVADNASASHYVLGNDQKKLEDIDLLNCKMEMSVNGKQVSTGTGKDCLGSPLIAVQWLAAQMAKVKNPLKKGDVILSGALGPMAPIAPGDEVIASIEGLGKVSMKFSK